METKSKTTVVQEGNPRGNAISSEEIKQGILDMTHFFEANAKDIYNEIQKSKPASQEDLKSLKDTIKTTLPLSLEVLLSNHNGGFLLRDNYKSLSVEQILDAIDVNQVNGYWKKNYIPFAGDDENNFLCLEHENGNDTNVVAWCADMGVIEEVADGLGLLIEQVRNDLLKKKIQYVEGAGLIEASG